jgi:hypothetical protein
MGELAGPEFKQRLEGIAAEPESAKLHCLSAGDDVEANRARLQRKAIEALATVGDLDTVSNLRVQCHNKPVSLDPRLERALYRTSEEIFWRLNWDRYL